MLAIALVAALLSVTLGGLVFGAAVRASHTARSGADLAAIAAALVLRDGGTSGSACARASVIANANTALLQACSVAGTHATVVVAVPVEVSMLMGTWRGSATARARAGQDPLGP
ncbi:MAG: hypothetical protein JWP82_2602 [Humibacillus sp.]|nr:hypothetical protein [Humibacillus sp.]